MVFELAQLVYYTHKVLHSFVYIPTYRLFYINGSMTNLICSVPHSGNLYASHSITNTNIFLGEYEIIRVV